ncbi:hypothetical protein LZ31DRAFT_274511 [Colletotrichum somersetense]|nr:hypothetical protein LZ31DRAFT_274511 [Colletotrichum somersetense]
MLKASLSFHLSSLSWLILRRRRRGVLFNPLLGVQCFFVCLFARYPGEFPPTSSSERRCQQPQPITADPQTIAGQDLRDYVRGRGLSLLDPLSLSVSVSLTSTHALSLHSLPTLHV